MLLKRLAIAGPVALMLAGGAIAQATVAPNPEIKGLFLTTTYPTLTLKSGEEAKLPVTLANYNLPPLRSDMTVKTAPSGWTVALRGSNRVVGAAFINPNEQVSFDLDVTVPEATKPGTYDIAIAATGNGSDLNLPITINVVAPSAAQLKLEPKLPILRGTARSNFDFQVKVTNDSADNTTLNLAAAAPDGFQVTFKEGYGTQELTSVPIKAGEAKDFTASIKPPQNIAAGRYPVRLGFSTDKANAETDVALDITGQASVSISGPDGRLSGEAYAGKERSFDLVVRNTGSADAREVKLSGSGPSGWKIVMEPKEIATLPPDQEVKVTALVTPSDKAIAGDYMTTFTASSAGTTGDARFRITVMTSTVWGIAGLGVIAAALLVMFGAVRRFGRR